MIDLEKFEFCGILTTEQDSRTGGALIELGGELGYHFGTKTWYIRDEHRYFSIDSKIVEAVIKDAHRRIS